MPKHVADQAKVGKHDRPPPSPVCDAARLRGAAVGIPDRSKSAASTCGGRASSWISALRPRLLDAYQQNDESRLFANAAAKGNLSCGTAPPRFLIYVHDNH
jgi:hypothetical protein